MNGKLIGCNEILKKRKYFSLHRHSFIIQLTKLFFHMNEKLIGCNEILKKRRYFTEVLYDFLVTVKAALHECVIRTGQP